MDQVRISRDGVDAIIEFIDPDFAVTHLRIGPHVQVRWETEQYRESPVPVGCSHLRTLFDHACLLRVA